jgi:hypothetical protein
VNVRKPSIHDKNQGADMFDLEPLDALNRSLINAQTPQPPDPPFTPDTPPSPQEPPDTIPDPTREPPSPPSLPIGDPPAGPNEIPHVQSRFC